MLTLNQTSTQEDSSAAGTSAAVALALGAGLAGVAPAHADLIESSLGITVADGSTVSIDFNNDGIDDFDVEAFSTGSGFNVRSIPKLQTVSETVDFSVGDFVDETASFAFSRTFDWSSFGGGSNTGFVGVRTLDDGVSFFGWLEVTRGSAILGRTGRQNSPSTGALITPAAAVSEPGSLASLALGAAGLAAWRRRKNKA